MECSRKTDAIIEARVEREPEPNGSWLGTLERVRALKAHVEMEMPVDFKKTITTSQREGSPGFLAELLTAEF